MTKFNTFEPQPRDLWRTTDPNAFPPLIPYIQGKVYAEPCYGAGDLEEGIGAYAVCDWRSDIKPQSGKALQKNAIFLTKRDVEHCDYIVSNPPFSFAMLQPLLDHLPTLKPTWLLLPSDMAHNKRMRGYMDRCSLVLSVGRLFFHKGGEDASEVKYSRGTANNCWYLFHSEPCDTKFVGWMSK